MDWLAYIFARGPLSGSSTVIAIAASMTVFAPVVQVRADSSDVANALVYKEVGFSQTSTNDPIQIPTPYGIYIRTTATATGRILSATVTPPGRSEINLNLNANAEPAFFEFGQHDFADQNALDAAFPNGTYNFTIQTVTAPTVFAPAVTIAGDDYPGAPKLLNNNWVSGALRVDPAQDFTFSLNPLTGQGGLLRIFAGADLVFSSNDPPGTSVLLPAGTLQPGQIYQGSVDAYNQHFSTDGSTGLFADYFATTYFTVDTRPIISSPLVTTGMIGQLFVYQIAADNTPTSYSADGLPSGLTIDTTTGTISGFPDQPGSSQVAISAFGPTITGTASLTINIAPLPTSGPVITSTNAATGRTGQFFAFQVLSRGASAAARASATGLPPGLTIDDVSGLISGTPTTDGSFAVNVTITDGQVTASQILELTFTSDAAIPVIISPSTAALAPGQPFIYTIAAPTVTSPGDQTIFSIVGTLPAGLGFDSTTGVISGIPSSRSERVHTLTPLVRALDDTPVVGVVQLVASNGEGTATKPLIFVPPAPNPLFNISTRLQVGTNDNVLIGGFVISGTEPKRVVLRAIGGSLATFHIPGVLGDPAIQIFSNGAMIYSNDNWQDSEKDDLIASGLAPSDSLESAELVVLNPGAYTAIVRGNGNTTGVGSVELFDLTPMTSSTVTNSAIANISTRGFVQNGDNVMIGGFIVGPNGTGTAKVLVRAIGPSLANPPFNLSGVLADPTLELHDVSGATLFSNDNWKDTQQSDIQLTGLAPTNNNESALIATLTPGSYTAIVRGKSGATGLALVEVYALQ